MTYNLQDTTIHGLYYLARSKSKRNIVFWSIVTIFGVVYATLEIASEIKTTFRTSQFDVQYRTIDKGLEKYPELGIFFSDWTYTVDWRLAEELADEVNLSETEYALWFSGMHDHIWQWNNSLEDKFLLMKKFSSYGNWSETDKSNNSNVRQIWRKFSRYFRNYLSIFSQCSPTAKKFDWVVKLNYPKSMVAVCTNISYNSNFDYHYHKQTMHFQLMNYTAETSSHKKTRFLLKQYTYHQQKQLMLKFFVHHSRVRKLYTSTIGDAGSEYNIEVKPMLTNYPTSELIDCQDSVTLFKEVGYRCFEWQYSVSLSGYSKYEDTHQVFSSNIKSTNMMSNDTNRNITLNVIFPPRRQWVMQEYKPVFQFYAFIAKIGGTLGLWTGASIVSFVHLVKLILSKLVASSDKVANDETV